jgi:hypothetical protein
LICDGRPQLSPVGTCRQRLGQAGLLAQGEVGVADPHLHRRYRRAPPATGEASFRMIGSSYAAGYAVPDLVSALLGRPNGPYWVPLDRCTSTPFRKLCPFPGCNAGQEDVRRERASCRR